MQEEKRFSGVGIFVTLTAIGYLVCTFLMDSNIEAIQLVFGAISLIFGIHMIAKKISPSQSSVFTPRS